jgi:hypothetical protein
MITINLNKAKEIAHEKRRLYRSEEFKPLDLKATIPSESAQAELKRQEIRDRYAAIQNKIDSAQTVDQLKDIITKELS